MPGGVLVHSGGNHGQVLARAAALAAELLACVGELPTPEENSPPAIEERGALSTEEAARRLGVTPYTLREWARLGKVRARQDSPRGRRHFDPADIAAYKAEHTRGELPRALAGAYSAADEPRRSTRPPTEARVNTSGTRGGHSGYSEQRRPMGTRHPPGKLASRGRPFAPGIDAWSGQPRAPKTRPPEPEPKG